MKKFYLLTIIILVFTFTYNPGYSQGLLPPNPPPTGHSQNGNQTGGNAPVGNGLIILLGLSIVYASKKTAELLLTRPLR